MHDLRDYTTDRHRVVDDVPFGGGPGMVLKPEPLFRAVERIRERARRAGRDRADDAGRRALRRTPTRERLSRLGHVVMLCGRYEGVDERVRPDLATEELSIGDYVLSGGELPALVIVDAVARLVPGVVGDEESVARDTFARGLLDSRSTRGRRSSGAWRCRRCCCPGTTRRSSGGGGARRWRERSSAGRICWAIPHRWIPTDRALLKELLEQGEKGAL